MNKFKTGIVEDIKKEKEAANKQESLHKKYKVGQKEVFIVEKNNMIKFFVRIFISGVRITCTVAILVLAAIGPDDIGVPGNKNAVFVHSTGTIRSVANNDGRVIKCLEK